MRKRYLSVAVAALTFLAVAAMVSDVSDAEEAPDEVHYSYGDTVQLHYPHTDGAVLSWTVYLQTSSGTEVLTFGNQTVVSIDSVIGIDMIRAVLTATLEDASDTKVYEVHPIPISQDADDDDGRYTVRFLDGTRTIGTTVIDGDDIFEYGEDPFFEVPDPPEREGYTFLGWYTLDGTGMEVRLGESDHMEPVYSDVDYYAKWVDNGTGSGGGSGGTVVVEETHLVTFQADPGLYCTVNSSGEGFVNFTVSVYEGFHYGGVRVASDAGTVSGSGMVYTLSGIDSDVTVTVTGDRLFAVAYHVPDGTVVSAAGYGDNPGLVSGGPLLMTVDGPGSMEVFVFMGSRDVSADCVRGDVISIAEVTGDILVLVNDTTPVDPSPGPDTPEGPAEGRGEPFPWWIVAVVAAMLLVYIVLRSRS